MRCYWRMVPSLSPKRIFLQRPPLPTTNLQCQPSVAALYCLEGGRSLRRRLKGKAQHKLFQKAAYKVVLLVDWFIDVNVLLLILLWLIEVLLCVWRFIQQVNQAAVTIQRWYRRHAKRQHTNQAALKRILASKRKVSICPQAALFLTFYSPQSKLGLCLSFC